MAKVAITEQYLQDIADAIRTKTGLSDDYYPSGMATAILSISGGGGIVPTGTINISSNGTHNVTQYASAAVSVPNSYTSSDEGKVVSSGALVSQTSATYTSNNTYDTTTINSVTVNVGSTINNQDKTVNPSTSQQSITADSGYSGLGTVTINAMPAGSATAPASISGSSATVSTGTNTLTFSKTISVTPTVSAGYVSSGTAGNSNISLTASVTTKGAATITPTTTNQTISSGTYLTGTQTIVGDADLVAGNIKKNVQIFGVTGTYEGGGGGTPTIDSLTVTPSETEQTFNSSSVDGYKPVTVSAISSTYVGTGITRRSSTDLTASGATVTVPAGYYASQASKAVSTMTLPTSASTSATSGYTSKASISAVSGAYRYINIPPGYNSTGSYYRIEALLLEQPTFTSNGVYYASDWDSHGFDQVTVAIPNGSATGPSSLSGTSATVSTGTNTLTLTKTGVTTTPTVSAGYIASATASTATVSLTANVTTKAAATITPGTTNQTIASGTYLTGTQTIAGDADLVASNIVNGVQIFGVTGNVVLQNYYTGSSAPSSSTGSNGDLYLQS